MAAQEQEPQPACILSVEVTPRGIVAHTEKSESDSGGVEAGAEETEALPVKVDAGAEMTLTGTIACSPARDLRGMAILLRDREGSALGKAEIAEFDGEINTTADLVIRAPLQAGEHEWLAVLPAHTAGGVDYEEVAAPFPLVVRAHATSITVWDVPTAIVAGQPVRFKIGVKCSSECRPVGWRFEVDDQDGETIATGALSDEPWPGTAALYFAEVEGRAPDVEGLHHWTVTAPRGQIDVPHEEHTARFGVRSVPQPECLVTIEAIDRASQSPVKGAKVAIHPYRGVYTDDQGRAEVRVPKGAYTVFVSSTRHVPFRTDSEVTADMSIRAELILDRELTEADLWA